MVCLSKIIEHFKTWENKPLVTDALNEIIDVHHRHRKIFFEAGRGERVYSQKFPILFAEKMEKLLS